MSGRPKSFTFFTSLTEKIAAFVARVAADSPGAFHYKGMDFSHAIETWFYFNLANSDALYGLYEGTWRAGSSRRVSAPVWLMSGFWFGHANNGRLERLYRWAIGRLRFLRMILGRTALGRSRAQAHEAYDLLLFATSLRFARYLMPVADAWKGRCAFLVNYADTALQDALARDGRPFVTYGPARPRWRRAGKFLAQHAPGLALLADEIEAAVKGAGARVVLLSEGNAPDDEVVNLVGHRLGVPVACLQQGWSPLIHSGFRNMHYHAMLVWGQGFSDLLAPCNPSQRFISVGNHMLSENYDTPAWKRGGIAIFAMGSGLWMRPEDEDLLLGLVTHLAAQLPENTIYVRPHPLHPFADDLLRQWQGYPNIQVAAGPHFSLADVMAHSRVAVSIYSSTILESIAAGTLPIVFNMTTMPRYVPDIEEAGAGFEVRTFVEAASTLIQLMRNPEGVRNMASSLIAFQSSFFAARGGAAVARITAALERLAGEEGH